MLTVIVEPDDVALASGPSQGTAPVSHSHYWEQPPTQQPPLQMHGPHLNLPPPSLPLPAAQHVPPTSYPPYWQQQQQPSAAPSPSFVGAPPPPPDLPYGWEEILHSSGRPFYRNSALNKVSIAAPLARECDSGNALPSALRAVVCK